MLITKHYYKASGNINQYVYCPPLPSTHSRVHSFSFLYLKTFLEVSRSSQDWAKQKSKARDIPEVCSWARISHCSPGRNSKRNSCPCEAVIKYSTSPMRGRRAKPAAKKYFISFLFLFKYRNLWCPGRTFLGDFLEMFFLYETEEGGLCLL